MTPPSHLLKLDTGWSIWREFCLRGAGFRAVDVLPLASAALASMAEAVLDAEEASTSAQGRAREVLRAEAARLKAANDSAGLSAVRALVRHLGIAGEERLNAVHSDCRAPVDDARAAHGTLVEASSRYRVAYEAAVEQIAAYLRTLAGDARFRSAITWQNRGVVETTLDALVRAPEGKSNARLRSKERIVAIYLQRYCTKNDTIGFFGPCGWGSFVESDEPIVMRPGSRLVSQRTTRFEHWAMDRVAQVLTDLPGVRENLPPRLSPVARLERQTLRFITDTINLTREQWTLLSRCDGTRSALAIARSLSAEGRDGLSESEWLALLADAQSHGWVLWALEIPTFGVRFDVHLRALLEKMADRRTADVALARLDALLDRAVDVRSAPEDDAALNGSLRALDASFTELTGQAPTRAPGQTYAGRTLLIEDCRRDIDLRLGASVLEKLRLPLSFLLTSGRWFSHHAAERYAAEFAEIFREIQTAPTTDRIPLLEFLPRAAARIPRMGGVAPPSILALVQDYQDRWQRLLELDLASPARRVHRSAISLPQRAAELFKAPRPGWPTARYHSPDLLLSARSEEAIRNGDCQFVLGEMHWSCNTLEQDPFLWEHANPQELIERINLDIPTGRLAPAVSKGDAVRGRTTPISTNPGDLEVEHDDARSWRPRDQVLPISELDVVRDQHGIFLETRGERRRWDIVSAFDLLLTDFSVPIFPSRPHTPRITLDDFVIAREAWQFHSTELEIRDVAAGPEGFLAARRWRRSLGLPRRVFCSSSAEVKPVLVDFDSPALVENFQAMTRKDARIRVSEMLPDIEDLWLVDGEGDRYTCELRIVAVDDYAWRPGPVRGEAL